MNTLKRWRAYVRQYSFGGLVLHLVARFARPVWEQDSAEILVLQPPVPDRQARVPVRIGELDRVSADAASLLQPDWERRWSRGDVCYGAWSGDVLVHHSWVATGDTPIGELHGQIAVGPGEAYVYDCFTSDTCRGQGIFPAVLSHIGQLYTNRGLLRLWIAVEHTNRSSVKAIERAGFRRAGSVSYRRLGASHRTLVVQEPGAPAFNFIPQGAR